MVRRAAGPHIGLFLLIVVYLSVRAFWTLSERAGASFNNAAVEGAAKLALWGIVSVVATMAAMRCGPRASLRMLGLLERGLPGAGLMLLRNHADGDPGDRRLSRRHVRSCRR